MRAILPDPVAREHFLSDEGDLKSATLRLARGSKKTKGGLEADLDAVVEAVQQLPWTALAELKGNHDILKKIDDTEALLKSLRKTLSS